MRNIRVSSTSDRQTDRQTRATSRVLNTAVRPSAETDGTLYLDQLSAGLSGSSCWTLLAENMPEDRRPAIECWRLRGGGSCPLVSVRPSVRPTSASRAGSIKLKLGLSTDLQAGRRFTTWSPPAPVPPAHQQLVNIQQAGWKK